MGLIKTQQYDATTLMSNMLQNVML